MKRGRSLARRIAVLTSLGFGVFWLLATLVMAIALQREQEEMLDLTLRETALLFQPVLAERFEQGETGLLHLSPDPGEPDEALIYLMRDAAGDILLQADLVESADIPDGPPQEGYAKTATHTFYTTPPDGRNLSVSFGDPNTERREAYRDSLLAFMLPMIALLPLAYLLVGWIARTALRPLGDLRSEIAARNEGRLDPIAASDQPEELSAISETLNGLMGRLGRAIDGERMFASNAAHELRTPVATALAQAQRLKAESPDSSARDKIERIEAALLRMSDLVARLLQLARSDAGIGAEAEPQDLAALLSLILDETRRNPARAPRLQANVPNSAVMARIDADAFAILAGNLIDNAFRHSPPDTPVRVALTADAVLRVENDGPPIPAPELAKLTRRFHRGAGSRNGFGLGLHIADAIARQSGGTLRLMSPTDGHDDGFGAVFQAAI